VASANARIAIGGRLLNALKVVPRRVFRLVLKGLVFVLTNPLGALALVLTSLILWSYVHSWAGSALAMAMDTAIFAKTTSLLTPVPKVVWTLVTQPSHLGLVTSEIYHDWVTPIHSLLDMMHQLRVDRACLQGEEMPKAGVTMKRRLNETHICARESTATHWRTEGG
jgi:hypothetical protein